MGQVEKDRFVNRTAGQIGVNVFGPKNEPTAIALGPGEEIELSEEEQQMTANAPRDPSDNPFLPRAYKQQDPSTGEVIAEGTITPLELVTEARPTRAPVGRPTARNLRSQSEETGAAPEPVGAPAAGGYASGEEVGTPDAGGSG